MQNTDACALFHLTKAKCARLSPLAQDHPKTNWSEWWRLCHTTIFKPLAILIKSGSVSLQIRYNAFMPLSRQWLTQQEVYWCTTNIKSIIAFEPLKLDAGINFIKIMESKSIEQCEQNQKWCPCPLCTSPNTDSTSCLNKDCNMLSHRPCVQFLNHTMGHTNKAPFSN